MSKYRRSLRKTNSASKTLESDTKLKTDGFVDLSRFNSEEDESFFKQYVNFGVDESKKTDKNNRSSVHPKKSDDTRLKNLRVREEKKSLLKRKRSSDKENNFTEINEKAVKRPRKSFNNNSTVMTRSRRTISNMETISDTLPIKKEKKEPKNKIINNEQSLKKFSTSYVDLTRFNSLDDKKIFETFTKKEDNQPEKTLMVDDYSEFENRLRATRETSTGLNETVKREYKPIREVIQNGRTEKTERCRLEMDMDPKENKIKIWFNNEREKHTAEEEHREDFSFKARNASEIEHTVVAVDYDLTDDNIKVWYKNSCVVDGEETTQEVTSSNNSKLPDLKSMSSLGNDTTTTTTHPFASQRKRITGRRSLSDFRKPLRSTLLEDTLDVTRSQMHDSIASMNETQWHDAFDSLKNQRAASPDDFRRLSESMVVPKVDFVVGLRLTFYFGLLSWFTYKAIGMLNL